MSHRWEVFGRRTAEDPLSAVGAVHAPDKDMALLLAKECFFRHLEGVDFAVVRTSDIHAFPHPDMLQPATDKTYRLQTGYTGLGDKRRRAAATAQELGRVVGRRRPQDKRVRNPEHRSRERAGA